MERSKIFLFIVFFIALIFKPDQHLDLFRYYEQANSSMWSHMSLVDVAIYNFESHGDFLYFAILKLFVDLGLPVQLVTAISAVYFYKGGLLILEDCCNSGNYSNKSRKLAEIALFFTLPIHLTLSIARMTCSFAFLFMAIHNFNKKKYIYCLLLTLSSLCTHAGSSLFVLLMAFALFLQYISMKIGMLKISSNKIAPIIMIGGTFLISLFPLLYDFLLTIPFFSERSYYLTYVNDIKRASFRENGFITFFSLILYIILNAVYVLKSRLSDTNIYYSFIPCFVVISYSLGNLFCMRSCMFSIPFFAICLMSAYDNSKNKKMLRITTYFTTMLFITVMIAFNRLYI